MDMEQIKIALLGFGTIGGGVYTLLNENADIVAKNTGKQIIIKRVFVRESELERCRKIGGDIFTADIDDIFNDDEIRIVVELMGGEQPATEFMLRAMNAGKSVVTANKMAIAVNGREMSLTATKNNVHFCYEASVGGGIPIIKQITSSLGANRIQSIMGILNGTSNYILTKMTEKGMAFDDALKLAQKKGYAEADPTSDVGGYDAVYKLSILSTLAFGQYTDYEQIYRQGIEDISDEDIKFADGLGYVIKLLAVAKQDNEGKTELRVCPTMIPKSHPMASINGSYNAVYMMGNMVDDVMTTGKGAGARPTASAVVSDIMSIAMDGRIINTPGMTGENILLADSSQTQGHYYIRLLVDDKAGVLAEISGIFAQNDVGILSLTQQTNWEGQASIIFITHMTHEQDFRKSCDEIEKLDCVKAIANVIAIEGIVSYDV